ncbi:beta-carotene 15,15'-monooxygenase [Neobacillus mesonae]|uniref:Beta-carotene 15,15'-monooxygenase n=2 Tax=Neobacillus mesonae TaxID=1193713 RepID=A0A3T0HXW6_9BACI|nr:beta-carotene 15,15'-monooxygenase [Neobacillus mesonae]AZU61913.1 beta-carotene 15,15'-monooxygenase [Neobacillus mesonae]
MVVKRTLHRNIWLFLLLMVLSANYSLYHTPFGNQILPEEPHAVVIASMIDLAVVAPILLMAWKRKLEWKNLIIGIAGGLILVRFLIPMEYLAPFEAVTWIGFAVEGGLLLLEFLLIVTIVKFVPKLIRSVKSSSLPVTFAFSKAVDEQMKPHPLIRIICSEMLMFYYAFATWRKKTPTSTNEFTLHQKSSLIAMQIMLIHAVVLETVGLHWFFHEKSIILSIVLLILNLYTVLFFIGDIQAVRHNPIVLSDEKLYLSLGLMKRMEIKWTEIENLIENPEQLKQKLSKNTIDFIARDFDEVHPDVILKLKQPSPVTLIMGMKKEFDQVAIRVDEPLEFKALLREKLGSVSERG